MAQRPHVLLVICDQMQNRRLGVVDPVASTPALDRLAGEGIRFSHVYCSNPQCELANLADPARLAADPRLAAVRAELSARVEGWWHATWGLDFAAYESPEFKARGVATLQAPPGGRRGPGAAGARD